MQFKVPQFLEIEDKIFGPFTFKQFAYLTGGAGLCYILYKLLGLLIGIVPILAIAGLSLALTFYKPNGKPFITMVEASIKYFMQSKLYIWKRHQVKIGGQGDVKKVAQVSNDLINENRAKLNGSKLRDLAWSLDILDSKKQ